MNNISQRKINELFHKLNMQIEQDKQIHQLKKQGYLHIEHISQKLECPKEILFAVSENFKDCIKTFQQPNGDNHILLDFTKIKQWYDQENQNAIQKQNDINNYLYKKYIGVDFIGYIPFNAAKDFTNQKKIPSQHFQNAIQNNEIKVIKYFGEKMIKENDLEIWLKNKENE